MINDILINDYITLINDINITAVMIILLAQMSYGNFSSLI